MKANLTLKTITDQESTYVTMTQSYLYVYTTSAGWPPSHLEEEEGKETPRGRVISRAHLSP
jgi:hypothetical protein